LLKTESGRGYRLLGDWTVGRHDAAKPPVGVQGMRVGGESLVTNFPAPVTRLVGRTAAVARLLSAYRAVTLTGADALEAATQFLPLRMRLSRFHSWQESTTPLPAVSTPKRSGRRNLLPVPPSLRRPCGG
jgi:hypothetical protein